MSVKKKVQNTEAETEKTNKREDNDKSKNKIDNNNKRNYENKIISKNTREGELIVPKVLQERSISSTKQDFPSIFKMALNGQEVITGNFKSKSEDTVSILSTKDFKYILDIGFKFNPIIEEDEEGNGYTVALDEIMVFGDGDTLEEALDDLVENTLDYARMYFEKLDFYKQIPNRRSHYPYLRRIVTCATKEEVLEVISECHTNLQQVISKILPND
jgi:hypothetical protein